MQDAPGLTPRQDARKGRLYINEYPTFCQKRKPRRTPKCRDAPCGRLSAHVCDCARLRLRASVKAGVSPRTSVIVPASDCARLAGASPGARLRLRPSCRGVSRRPPQIARVCEGGRLSAHVCDCARLRLRPSLRARLRLRPSLRARLRLRPSLRARLRLRPSLRARLRLRASYRHMGAQDDILAGGVTNYPNSSLNMTAPAIDPSALLIAYSIITPSCTPFLNVEV